MMIKSINPFSGKKVNSYETHTIQGTNRIISSVDKAFHSWRSTSFQQRAVFMLNLASILRSKKEELAKLMAIEMGKVMREGVAEIEKCAWVCEYYAQNAETMLENETIETQ